MARVSRAIVSIVRFRRRPKRMWLIAVSLIPLGPTPEVTALIDKVVRQAEH
jgi:hypothetical protein